MRRQVEVRPDNYAEVVAQLGKPKIRCRDAHGVWVIGPDRDWLATFGVTLSFANDGEICIVKGAA